MQGGGVNRPKQAPGECAPSNRIVLLAQFRHLVRNFSCRFVLPRPAQEDDKALGTNFDNNGWRDACEV